MSVGISEPIPRDPNRYFDHVAAERGALAESEPVCLYLETTNRCNLLCTTCPRTFEALEPPADMSWDLFTRIVDQFPHIARVVLHGVGEPMMVRALPRMIRYLKDRGTYVLFNTNGAADPAQGAGADRQRPRRAARPRRRRAARLQAGARARHVRPHRAQHPRLPRETAELAVARPRVSLWLTGLKETVAQLNDFVRLAHDIDVAEVYLQRLVYFPEGQGLARPESALFAGGDDEEGRLVREAEALARELGVRFNASGATDPSTSLAPQDEARPWSLCRRPWTLMYFTALGRAIPCCIAPFSLRGYDSFTLGDATQQSLREIWNGPRYQQFRDALLSDDPPPACANCGLRWSL